MTDFKIYIVYLSILSKTPIIATNILNRLPVLADVILKYYTKGGKS
jgi:hypothetical protein